jgi:hypothetical protein
MDDRLTRQDMLLTDLDCAGQHSDIEWLLLLCSRSAEIIRNSALRQDSSGGVGKERQINALSGELADVIGCARFQEAMLKKLGIKRAEGKYGWNDPDVCSTQDLAVWLEEHFNKGDPVDIANYCMMIWNRVNPLASQESRSEVLYTKADIEAACEIVLAGFRSKPMLDKMVDRFLSWPLPSSVCSDACVVQRGYPHRIGTNLLTADEARQMLEHVLPSRAEAGASVAGRDPIWTAACAEPSSDYARGRREGMEEAEKIAAAQALHAEICIGLIGAKESAATARLIESAIRAKINASEGEKE